MGVVTLTMAFGFAMMGRVPAGRAVLAVVWVCHILYFIFGIRTIAPEETAVPLDAAGRKRMRRPEKQGLCHSPNGKGAAPFPQRGGAAVLFYSLPFMTRVQVQPGDASHARRGHPSLR